MELLDIPEGAERNDVKTRFKELVRTEHPDKRPDDPQAVQKFGRIMAAYKLVMEAPTVAEDTGKSGNDLWDAIRELEGVEVLDVSKMREFEGFVDLDGNKETKGGVKQESESDDFRPRESRPGAFQEDGGAQTGTPGASYAGEFSTILAPDRRLPSSQVSRMQSRTPSSERAETTKVRSVSLGDLADLAVLLIICAAVYYIILYPQWYCAGSVKGTCSIFATS